MSQDPWADSIHALESALEDGPKLGPSLALSKDLAEKEEWEGIRDATGKQLPVTVIRLAGMNDEPAPNEQLRHVPGKVVTQLQSRMIIGEQAEGPRKDIKAPVTFENHTDHRFV